MLPERKGAVKPVNAATEFDCHLKLNQPALNEGTSTVLGKEFRNLLAILGPTVLLRRRLLARIALQFALP
jgi:hypothetical protein